MKHKQQQQTSKNGRFSSLLNSLNISIGAPSNKPVTAPAPVKKGPPPTPPLQTQSTEYRQRLHDILEYLQFFVHAFEGRYMMSQIEKILTNPKAVEEPDLVFKTAMDIMSILDKGLKIAGMEYYEWIEYCARNRENEENKKCLWNDFLREMNQIKLTTKNNEITEEDIRILFKFIAGDNIDSDEAYVDHCNMDLAAKKIQANRDKLAHLTKIYNEVKYIGGYMRMENIHIGGEDHVMSAMLPIGDIERLIHPIVWQYDWHVKEVGPIDLKDVGLVEEQRDRSNKMRSNRSENGPQRNAGVRGSFSLRTFLGFNTIRSNGSDKSSGTKTERLGLASFFKPFVRTNSKIHLTSSDAAEPSYPSPNPTKQDTALFSSSSDLNFAEQETVVTGNFSST